MVNFPPPAPWGVLPPAGRLALCNPTSSCLEASCSSTTYTTLREKTVPPRRQGRGRPKFSGGTENWCRTSSVDEIFTSRTGWKHFNLTRMEIACRPGRRLRGPAARSATGDSVASHAGNGRHSFRTIPPPAACWLRGIRLSLEGRWPMVLRVLSLASLRP